MRHSIDNCTGAKTVRQNAVQKSTRIAASCYTELPPPRRPFPRQEHYRRFGPLFHTRETTSQQAYLHRIVTNFNGFTPISEVKNFNGVNAYTA
jgi:hypothetical protein